MAVRFVAFILGAVISAALAAAAFADERPRVEVVAQIGHSGSVDAVAFSRDGRQVLSGSFDHTLKLWDTNSGLLLRTLAGHSDAVKSVAFSPVGAKVLSGSFDMTLKLWDAGTGQVLRTFVGHSDSVNAVAFSPDGSMVLSGSSDQTLKLWDASSGRLLRTFKGHSAPVNAIAFSPDGTKCLSGSGDGTLKLWNVSSGQLLRTFSGHSREVTTVAFSPDGSKLVSGSEDNTLRIWDAASGTQLLVLAGHKNTIRAATFSTDGGGILSASSDWTLRLWDVSTGKLLSNTEASGRLASAVFSPTGRSMLVGTEENGIELRDVATGRILLTFGSPLTPVVAVAFSADGSTVVSANSDNILKVWDAATGRLQYTFKASKAVTSVAFSPDSRELVAVSTGSEDPPWPDKLALWDVASGKLLRNSEQDMGFASSVAFSPDGRRLLTGGAYETNESLNLWDTATGKLLRAFKTKDGVFSVAFSPDGRKVVSAGGRAIDLWNADTGNKLRTLKVSEELTTVAFSPNGKTIVSGGDSGVQLWDAVAGRSLHTWNFGKVSTVSFSPDGSRVLAGCWDNTLKEVDLATGKLLRTFTGHSGKVNAIAFSRDGRVASGSDDGTVRIWPASAGTDVVTLLATADGSRFALTSSGFFDDEGDVNSFVHLVRGFEVLTLGQVHQALFSPDLVREALTGDANGEVRRAAQVVSLEKVLDSGPAPDVDITSPAPGTSSNADLVAVSARITDRGKGIGRIEWRVNGVTVGVCRGTCSGSGSEASRQLALDPGENNIEVVAYDARDLLASPPSQTIVIYSGAPGTTVPKLHVLAIGINNYVDQGGVAPGGTMRQQFAKLGLAVGDAKAIAVEFRKAGQGLYDDVRVRTVLDEEASAGNLDAIVTEFAAEIHPRDTFVLFAAAHGYTNDGRFYLIPQDYSGGPDPEALKAHAIDQLKLQDWIANRVKAKKALILLDTCESGALTNGYLRSRVDGPASDASIGRLQEATGRPVLTAAAQGQSAIELEDIEHGIFTAALIDGLRHAQAGQNGDVMLSSLVNYVEDIVPKLVKSPEERKGLLKRGPVGGEQSVRFGSRGEDFAIVRRTQ
jgi:WD40 repeat protein